MCLSFTSRPLFLAPFSQTHILLRKQCVDIIKWLTYFCLHAKMYTKGIYTSPPHSHQHLEIRHINWLYVDGPKKAKKNLCAGEVHPAFNFPPTHTLDNQEEDAFLNMPSLQKKKPSWCCVDDDDGGVWGRWIVDGEWKKMAQGRKKKGEEKSFSPFLTLHR